MSNSHAPTPWAYRQLFGPNGYEYTCITADRGETTIARIDGNDELADEANAAFVVRGANAFAALVEALKACASRLDSTTDAEQAYAMAQEALALAEGGKK